MKEGNSFPSCENTGIEGTEIPSPFVRVYGRHIYTDKRKIRTDSTFPTRGSGMLVTVQVTIAVVVPSRTSPVLVTLVRRQFIPVVGKVSEASGVVQATVGTLVEPDR